MSRVFLAIVILISSVTLSVAQGWDDIIARSAKSVVLVKVDVLSATNVVVASSHGTGFVVTGSEGNARVAFVVSNRHVVAPKIEPGQKTRITGYIGNGEGTSGRLLLISVDDNADLALLRFVNTPPNAEGVTIGSKGMAGGESVLVVGFPALDENAILSASPANGLVQSLAADFEGKAVTQIEVTIRPGNSGGPIFNQKGEVVGVIFSRRKFDQAGNDVDNVGYAFPIRAVIGLLNEAGVQPVDASQAETNRTTTEPPENGWVWVGYLDRANKDQWATGPFVEIERRSAGVFRQYPIREGDIVRPTRTLNQVIVDFAEQGDRNVLTPPPSLVSVINTARDYTGRVWRTGDLLLVLDVQVWSFEEADPVVWLRVSPSPGLVPRHAESSVQLRVNVENEDEASELKIADMTTETVAASDFSEQPIYIDVALGGSTERRTALLDWREGKEVSVPLLLTPAFAGKTIDVFFNGPFEFTEVPDRARIKRACPKSTPPGLESQFKMLQECRAIAHAVEEFNGDPADFQVAFCGWLRASNALYQRGNPVSPYGFDAELLDWINSSNGGVETACGSLSTTFTALVAAESARLAGTVPDLVAAGKIDEAIIVNDEALSTWVAADLPAGEFGLSEQVLLDNSKYLQTLKGRQTIEVLQ